MTEDWCEADVGQPTPTTLIHRRCSRVAVTERKDWHGKSMRVCQQHAKKLAVLKYEYKVREL